MHVEFKDLSDLKNVLRINDWSLIDKFDINYDELDGIKRIIIVKKEQEGIDTWDYGLNHLYKTEKRD